MKIALAAIALLAVAAGQTMEPGRFRFLTWVLLAFFAFRILMGRLRSRYDGSAAETVEQSRSGEDRQ
jgi:hypothetical protein